jgi:hypothetical protein
MRVIAISRTGNASPEGGGKEVAAVEGGHAHDESLVPPERLERLGASGENNR